MIPVVGAEMSARAAGKRFGVVTRLRHRRTV